MPHQIDDRVYQDYDIQAMMEFSGLTRDEVLGLCEEGYHRLIRLWGEANPQTDQERQRFYASTDAHIFEGIAWHSQISQWGFRADIAKRCFDFAPSGNVIDYGCGIATEGILALMAGCSVLFVDYPKMLEFVEARINARNNALGMTSGWHSFASLDISGHLNVDDDFDGIADVIICLDVLEHLEEPEALLDKFRRWLKPDGLFIGSAPFSELKWPGHLPKHQGKLLSKMCGEAGITNYWIDPIRPQWEAGVNT